jgi:hypothetical protein
MIMELEAIYGHLYMVGGRRQTGDPPGVVVRTGPDRSARGRSRDTLFVHLTLSSREPAPANLYQDVTDTLSDAFFGGMGSVTAALRQAIRAANEHLMRYNLRVEGVSKQRAGVTCAVLREEEVFIAQAGPTLTLIAHQGQLERLPPRPSGQVTPLGVGYGVDTRFYHSWVHPGDVILLSSPEFGVHDDDAIGRAIIYEGVTAGVANLAQLARDQTARLLLVEFSATMAPVAQQPPLQKSRASVSTPAVRTKTSTQLSLPDKLPVPAIEVDVKEEARKAASGLALGLARLTGGIGMMIERLFGGAPATGQAVKRHQGPPPAALALLAILIPVLVALIAVTVYLQRGRAAQFQDLLQEMDRESQLALAMEDEEQARPHWERIQLLSEDALRLRPAHPTVLAFREQAQGKLDLLDEVTRLVVRSLHKYQAAGDLSAVAVQSMGVYVLDSGLDQVYKHLLQNETEVAQGVKPENIVFKTQAIGQAAVGELIDMTWFPSSGEIDQDTIVILDAAGWLVRYDPFEGETTAAQLQLPSRWSQPVAMAVYGDTLYVLDTGARQIWKFAAEDNQFPAAPTTYRFENDADLDLGQMIDMTIDRDGNLYLLATDGSIYKYYGGERKPFTLTGLPQPLESPRTIYCSLTGLNPFFYIADPGSGRIVRTTQQGLFLAQYRAAGADLADPFTTVRSIYVQEVPALAVYATSGESLIVATLE